MTATVSRLRGEGLRVGYGKAADILRDVDAVIPEGELTIIIGPNACGKSTLLKTLARMLPTRAGLVLLDGEPIGRLAPKAVARRLGLLPQGPSAPDGITVSDLVARGRYPHQSLLRQWTPEDEQAVLDALVAANAIELADLDIAHQVEVLDLTRRLHRQGRTVVIVLHELHLAFRYATNIIVMRDGRIVAQGHPNDVVTADFIEEVFDLPCHIIPDPISGRPLVLPLDLDAAGR